MPLAFFQRLVPPAHVNGGRTRDVEKSLPFMQGREFFRRLCPYLDEAGATEGRQRQVGLPGEEYFCHLCPHLDDKTSEKLLEIQPPHRPSPSC